MDTEHGEKPIDDGAAIHYTAVRPGTPVYASDGTEVGRVTRVLDNYREHILDGVVFRDPDGKGRFADGPEVSRTAERGVTLNIGPQEALALGPPPKQASGGLLGRLFGGRR